MVVKNFLQLLLERSMRPIVDALFSRLSQTRKRVAVLISGSGTNLQALINATQDSTQHVGAEIVLVLSNIPDVEGLKRAELAGIATKVFFCNSVATPV